MTRISSYGKVQIIKLENGPENCPKFKHSGMVKKFLILERPTSNETGMDKNVEILTMVPNVKNVISYLIYSKNLRVMCLVCSIYRLC